MTSYSSDSSFLSGGSSPPNSYESQKGQYFPSPEFALSQLAEEEKEPLDHPLLSKYNKEVVVTDAQGFPMMQTKSAWLKQMAEKEKEDAKKAKKAARKAKHAPHPKVVEAPMTKKEKKAKKHGDEYGDDE
ncbi:hypothetical protein MNV49_001705 [Pseudohyphozyma bogoriensis]|nr:hypothetical protein MNV49_001705 [Pseudohyphozyma bogoriensis]